MVRILTSAILAVVLISPTAAFAGTAHRLVVAATTRIAMFNRETAAQNHCPADQVVWLNTRTRLYHKKGMPWYGRTDKGAYVCRKDADAAGYLVWRNGE